MRSEEAAMWGAAAAGMFALLVGGFILSFRLTFAPFYAYIQVVDFLHFFVAGAAMLLALTRARLVGLALWIFLSAATTAIIVSIFPDWGMGILHLSPSDRARFEGISFLSDGLILFGNIVLFCAGSGLLISSMRKRR